MDAFNVNWINQDAVSLAALWSEKGNIVHPDGAAEHGRQTIQQNRHEQFMRKEYRDSRLNLRIGLIRCLAADIAVVDGKWELRGVVDRAAIRAARPGSGDDRREART